MTDILTQKIETLQQKTLESRNYEDAVAYFFNELLPTPEFTEKGKTSNGDPFLMKALESSMRVMYENASGQDLNKTQVPLSETQAQIFLVELPEHHFYHGSVILKNGSGATFYFAESRTGILYLKFNFNPKVWVSRYGGVEVDDDVMMQYPKGDREVN